MKKILSLIVSFVLVFACFSLAGCANRSEQLKIYLPGEYISSDVLEDFEEWYEEKTGKKVTVVESNFNTVEEIFTAVEQDHADFDLICPSDYAVERLIKKNCLIEIDKDIIDIEQDGLIRSEFLERAKISDPQLKYSVPYMYGTFGIMYDTSAVEGEITSWDAIFTDKYGKNISSNKDSIREAIFSAAIYANREELKEASNGFTDYNTDAYQGLIKKIYSDFSSESIDKAIDALKQMRTFHTDTWGGEQLKYYMATGTQTNIKIALMWSCDAGYVMNDFEDDNGVEHEGNKNLWYVVPEEGGNIYLDNWVINKYAKNVEAAQYFLQYLCFKDVAIENSEYAGAISVVADAYNELKAEYENDDEIAKGAKDPVAWKKMYLETLFPSEETLARCGTMIDFGDADRDISLKFVNVKK